MEGGEGLVCSRMGATKHGRSRQLSAVSCQGNTGRGCKHRPEHREFWALGAWTFGQVDIGCADYGAQTPPRDHEDGGVGPGPQFASLEPGLSAGRREKTPERERHLYWSAERERGKGRREERVRGQ